MHTTYRILILNRRFLMKNYVFVNMAFNSQLSRPQLKYTPSKLQEVGSYGWFMLIIPISTFGLGIWQIQRKFWKENLILQMKERTESSPIELPQNIKEIKELEFRPVSVRGTFLHDKEIYMGPRGLIKTNEESKLTDNPSPGYLVITPFKLADRDETILINRGWVSSGHRKPSSRPQGQVEGVVNVIGLLRLNEHRPNFSMKNRENSNLYFYRDLEAMCASTGASPIFLDQTKDFNIPGGPVGGQTNVTLRNEHLSYIITWFSLSAATTYMWLKKYVLKRV
ncbi:hypothetical protein ABEB36_001186 [Hypothenemus hampei]|uniref:SURF1-like protein n=1 Tax=Hypothenemus hampei TaxID=57062 RepID=A0ABD1FGB2_HYPHA